MGDNGDSSSESGSKDRATVALVDAKVDGLKDLIRAEFAGVTLKLDEKLTSVAVQFALIERQRVEQKADTEKAVQAAFQAAKEAVKEQTLASEKAIQKSESATAEQLKQLTSTFSTAIGGVTDSLGDLKGRVGNIESHKQGSNERQLRYDISLGHFLVVLAIAVGIVFQVIHG